MFSSLGLFKQIECPEGLQCQVQSCLFTQMPHSPCQALFSEQIEIASNPNMDSMETVSKKRKHNIKDGHQKQPKPTSRINARVSQASHDLGKVTSVAPARNAQRSGQALSVTLLDKSEWNALERPGVLEPVETIPKTIEISLTPKIIHRSPATYAVRMKLVALLHEQMSRLNDELKRDGLAQLHALPMSPAEVITQALEEEERIAKDSPSVYTNVTKLRIMRLRGMRMEDWIKERQMPSSRQSSATAATKPVMSDSAAQLTLSPVHEPSLLARLFADQGTLDRQGYVTKQISDGDIEEARRGVETAQGWEQCHRCGTRFQVFPGRRASDGAMTSGGYCVYHPLKPRRPKSSHMTGEAVKEMVFECCNETLGLSAGCSKAPTHVFKILEVKRLATILPFQKTPPNPSAYAHKAICLDCEMGYTTCGFELIRLTATSWHEGTPLVDVLVRPFGELLDLNSRFSGVSLQAFTNAGPYEANSTYGQESHMSGQIDNQGQKKLMMVKSPSAARELLFSHLAPETPLIGHALDNDLNVTRIIHPSIVDTALLFPHPRGFPLRLGLKSLTKIHLHRDIQMDHKLGHDSVEDANAAGDLVRMYIMQKWPQLEKAR